MQFRARRGFVSGAGLIPRPDDDHRSGAKSAAATGTKLDAVLDERSLPLIVFEAAVGNDPFEVVNLYVPGGRGKRFPVRETIDAILSWNSKETKRKKNEQRENSAGHGSPIR